MPSRRDALVAAGALLATGCLERGGPTGPTDVEGTDDGNGGGTDGGPGDQSETPDCVRGFYVSATPFDPADLPVAVDEYPEPRRHVLRDAVADGSLTVETYPELPFRDGLHLRRDGVYYRLTVEQRDATEVTAYRTDLEWEDGQTAPDGADVLEAEDLPAVDRRALELLVHGTEYGPPYQHPVEGLTATDVPAPYPDGADDSVLVGAGESWVRLDGRTYRVEVTTETTTVTRRTYRLAVTSLATDPSTYRQHVVDRYLVDLDGAPADERAVLETAAEGTYEECEPESDALANLRDRLSAHDRLPPRYDDDWFVALDGDRYRVSVTSWVH